MEFSSVFYNLTAIVFGFISLAFGVLAIYVFFSDPLEYRRNKKRSRNFSSTLKGKIARAHDGFRDSRVHAGIAINSKNEWDEQGRLSDESINGIFRL